MSNINVANIVNPTTADSTPTDNLSKQVCRAWVNFNGVGTVAIRSAYNVSSITDNGTGNYTVNFDNPMSDANYSASLNAAVAYNTVSIQNIYERFTGSVSVATRNTTSGIDRDFCDLQIFGN